MINFKDSIDVIKEDNIKYDFNLQNEIRSYINESVFISVTNAAIKKQNGLIETTIKLMDDLKNDKPMLESFSDYYTSSHELIKEFVDFLDDKIEDFISYMQQFIKSDRVIEQHKDVLQKGLKNYKDNGSRPGFKYTIDIDVPNTIALSRFNENLFRPVVDTNTNDLSIKYLKDSTKYLDLDQDLRKFRGSLLGKDKEYSELEFAKVLYRIFRNDKSIEEERLKIDTDFAKEMINVWFGFNEISDNLFNHFKSFVSVFNNILDKISICVKNNKDSALNTFTQLLPGDINVDYIDGKDSDNYAKIMPAELQAQLDIFCKLKLDQLQAYTDYICLAFSAKMDAIKCMYEQYRLSILDMCQATDDPSYKPDDYTDGLERLSSE